MQKIKALCPKCEQSHYTAQPYTGLPKIPRIVCVHCKNTITSSEASSQKSKNTQGIKHSYTRRNEPKISDRGINMKIWEVNSRYLELEVWRNHRYDKPIPLPGWMLRLGDMAGI